MAAPRRANVQKLLKKVEESQLGFNSTLQGPFGTRRVVYTDYTASGKPLTFIEDYIRDEVLPRYGNTHTTTSITSRQTTFFREESRLIIRNAVNASEKDCVIFAGSGCTGAVHKLIHCLSLSNLPHPPVVFVSPFEHHSNLLPWREIGAEIVPIAEDRNGLANIHDLEQKLMHYSSSGRKLIGSLNAASNITGVLTDTHTFSAMLHKYGALAFWDYATAAPYVKIDMNPVVVSEDRNLVYKDAVFFSMHKFVGGPDSPGVLVAKKELFTNSTPHCCGGGTVFFVTPSNHRYFKEVEMREEGGTPAIISSIRAGLAMQLKEAIGTNEIMAREEELCKLAFSEWESVEELCVVGPHSIPRLPVFSFLIRHPQSGRFLHPNFICTLLNDLFGIQARGGCSCAGPYAQGVLGISEELAEKYEALVMEDSRLDRIHLRRYHEYSEREILRPGVTRLSFPYFMSREAVDFVLKAVAMVAKHGWKLLPQYQLNPETGLFRHHQHHPSKDRRWLSSISYESGEMVYPKSEGRPSSQELLLDEMLSGKDSEMAHSKSAAPSFEEALKEAQTIFDEASQYKAGPRSLGDQSLFLSEEAEGMRWFLLPSEAQLHLKGQTVPKATPPFEPKRYPESYSAEGKNEAMKEKTGASADACTSEGEQQQGAGLPDLRESQDSRLTFATDSTETHPSIFNSSPAEASEELTVKVNGVEAVEHTHNPHSLVNDNIEGAESSPYLESLNVDVVQVAVSLAIPTDVKAKFYNPPKRILKPTIEAIEEYNMIHHGDRVLVCLSGGKDSLSLLHTLHQYQFIAKAKGVEFSLGAVTVDPQSFSYNPRPLIPYLAALGLPYFYEEQGILQQAISLPECASICSFCSRMKRGRLYACARRESYNVLAMGQHLDDLAESFLMSVFHNGLLRTMKANYAVEEGDLRVTRPFVYVREKDLRTFADKVHLPVIPENCPACFEAPKERHRVKQLLAAQELLYPTLFQSLLTAMKPLMARDRTGLEARKRERDRLDCEP